VGAPFEQCTIAAARPASDADVPTEYDEIDVKGVTQIRWDRVSQPLLSLPVIDVK
jgi:hypothetical protein